ncbi:hypothetical protein [Haladaptatus sp. NG-SE-30]
MTLNPIPIVHELRAEVAGTETMPAPSRVHLEAAIRWLFRSQDVTGCGGSAATYNLFLGWADPYPETTGYIVPTLYDYAGYADAREARRRAYRMAEWLLTTQREHGGFPAGADPNSESSPSVFNTGQIIFGLIRAYRETGEEVFQEAARRAASWLLSVQHEDGYWDTYVYKDTVHSYSSRVGWSLIVAAKSTGSDAFRDAAKRNLDWVAEQRLANGWFEKASFERGQPPFLHTIAYTIRGLLEGAVLLDDDALFDAAQDSADRLLEVKNRDGVLRGEYDSSWNGSSYCCLTGNAQTTLVWLRLAELTGDPQYRSAAVHELDYLKSRHRPTGPLPLRGALAGSDPVWGRYLRFRYPNWAAKFFADALLALETR